MRDAAGRGLRAPPPRRTAVGGGTLYMTNIGLTITQRALLAGEDLGAATIAWGRRPEPPPRFALTDRDLRLMALLYGANFLSTSHLTALGWAFSQERAAQMRLKRWHDAAIRGRLPTGARLRARSSGNHRLTSRGFWGLRDREMVSDECCGHTRALLHQHCDDQLRTTRRGSPHHRAPHRRRRRRRWRGCPHRAERCFAGWVRATGTSRSTGTARQSARRLRNCLRVHPLSRSKSHGHLQPDATLIGRIGEDSWAVLIEYDRTERSPQADRPPARRSPSAARRLAKATLRRARDPTAVMFPDLDARAR